MGTLTYGCGTTHQIDDRPLQHLEAAVMTKLYRHENFLLSWTIGVDEGSGRVALWMGPTIPVQFAFAGSREAQLDRTWVELMLRLSYTSRGLVLLSEADVRAVKRGEKKLAETPSLAI